MDCIHIDPPYNTDTSGFLYKNNYKHSSWLSFMESRIQESMKCLKEKGLFFTHIDENEYEVLFLLNKNLGLVNCGTMIWDKRNPMNEPYRVYRRLFYLS
ncbi:DNA methyltransferase [Acinetobacter baumannii]|uniref:DNA methyltransferase n=1 Tax=Acinetobacter baumannii TaxID=470 RepID=UPI001D17919D|nr:DNA methyltransferase [Acinetobacter baumannii]